MAQIDLRTDLAVEASEGLKERDSKGIVTSEGIVRDGIKVTSVKILNEQSSIRLGKPVGKYYTFELDIDKIHDENYLNSISDVVAMYLGKLCNAKDNKILVVGLGNESITSDSVGPKACREIMAGDNLCVLSPGVLYQTGMETANIIKGVIKENNITTIIAIDALAARSAKRLCSTIQISDTGIQPGSGMGNHRNAINRETMDIPVIAVGMPTVIEAKTLLYEYGTPKEESCMEEMYVTPKDIDILVGVLGRCIGRGINQSFCNQMR